jgi:hypothetical protein
VVRLHTLSPTAIAVCVRAIWVTAEAVRIAPLEAKKAAVIEAVKSADGGEKHEVVAQAVGVAPLEAKMAAAAEAVNSASTENKVNVATEGVEQLSPRQQRELVSFWCERASAG